MIERNRQIIGDGETRKFLRECQALKEDHPGENDGSKKEITLHDSHRSCFGILTDKQEPCLTTLQSTNRWPHPEKSSGGYP
jgi:hypothetical protein